MFDRREKFNDGLEETVQGGNVTYTGNILQAKLPGSNFHDALLTATMVVAGLCFLLFFAMGIMHCIAGWRTNGKKFKASIGVSTFLLIFYFALYTADRIMIEIREKRVIMYYPFLIVLETISLVGDGLLMLFLLRAFSEALFKLIARNKESHLFKTIGLRILAWGLNILALANPAAYIYYLVSNRLLSPETKEAIKSVGEPRITVITAYRQITLAFYCIYIGASLIMAYIIISVLRKLKKAHTLDKKFRLGLPILVALLIVRSIIMLVYAALFKYGARGQSKIAKFAHIFLYGFLSVAIYGVIFWVMRSNEWHEADEATTQTTHTYTPGTKEQVVVTTYHNGDYAANAHHAPANTYQNNTGIYTFRNGA